MTPSQFESQFGDIGGFFINRKRAGSMTKQVRINNGDQFVTDFRRLYSFVAYTKTGFLTIKKGELWKIASEKKVNYYLTDKIYVQRRTTMVIV